MEKNCKKKLYKTIKKKNELKTLNKNGKKTVKYII